MKLLSLATHRLQPTRLLRPWDSPGKSTGVGRHCLLRREHTGDQQRQTGTPTSSCKGAKGESALPEPRETCPLKEESPDGTCRHGISRYKTVGTPRRNTSASLSSCPLSKPRWKLTSQGAQGRQSSGLGFPEHEVRQRINLEAGCRWRVNSAYHVETELKGRQKWELRAS